MRFVGFVWFVVSLSMPPRGWFCFFFFYFNGIRDIIFGRDALIRKG